MLIATYKVQKVPDRSGEKNNVAHRELSYKISLLPRG